MNSLIIGAAILTIFILGLLAAYQSSSEKRNRLDDCYDDDYWNFK